MHDVQAHAAAREYVSQRDEIVAGQDRGGSSKTQETALYSAVPQGSTVGNQAEGSNAGQRETENGNAGHFTAHEDITARQNVARDSALQERAVQRAEYAVGTRMQEVPRGFGRQSLGENYAEAEIGSEWAAAQLCSSRKLIEKVITRR
jgi:hypothetical protein